MKVYETSRIRNVALLGHGGSGKTTLAEALAYVCGVSQKMGRTTDGNTISDYDSEEKKRGFSISTSVIPVEYTDEKGEQVKINLLDTPGYFDFAGEAEEAASAADAAIIVINCKAGLEVGAEKAWELCDRFHLPRMIFVTNMDDDKASFRELLLQLETKFGHRVAPFHLPIRENEKLVGFVNVVKMEGRKYLPDGQYGPCDIPEYVKSHLQMTRTALMESVAETSEEYMERYLMEDEFTYDEISGALKENVLNDEMCPVLLGAGIDATGMAPLLNAICRYFPSPDQRTLIGNDANTGELIEVHYNSDANLSAKVWKTIVDPFIGKYSLVKVCTGTLKPDTTIYNVTKEAEEKSGKIYLLTGSKASEISEVKAGDIAAMAKLNVTQTGDSIAMKTAPILYPRVEYSKPYTYMAYRSVNKGEEDKIATGLARLMEEDVTLRTVVDAENKQSLIYGIGDQQLDVVKAKLLGRYKAAIELEKPKFAFRETIRKKVEAPGRYKKQSGGHGQFGDVKMSFEPSGDQETPYIFEEQVFGGAVPKNYFPAVEKGIAESCQRGPLAAYPVVGIKATLLDGSYHPVDSSEMAFKMAATIAFKKGFMEASPVLLEPIARLAVTVPDKFTGDVMGDLNKRRGRVLGMEADHHGKTIISAEVPMSEMFGYNTDLRSMTGGIGTFSYEFDHYEQAPGDVQAKEVAARASLLGGAEE